MEVEEVDIGESSLEKVVVDTSKDEKVMPNEEVKPKRPSKKPKRGPPSPYNFKDV